jgi:hypothetical protein
MSDTEFRNLRYEIEELPILHHIDVVHFEKIPSTMDVARKLARQGKNPKNRAGAENSP